MYFKSFKITYVSYKLQRAPFITSLPVTGCCILGLFFFFFFSKKIQLQNETDEVFMGRDGTSLVSNLETLNSIYM